MREKHQKKGMLKHKGLRALFLICAIFSFSFYAHAQQVKITGTVIDQENTPVIGAVVSVKGQSRGVSTDATGKYEISASKESVLDYSFIGFQTVSRTVGSRTAINVTLLEDVKLLDEVVVVGYTTIRKQSLTGSLETLKNEKLSNCQQLIYSLFNFIS